MRKIVLGILVGVLLLAGLAALILGMFLDRAAQAGIQTIGSRLAQVSVEVRHVNLRPLSGSGRIEGLVVRNPAGFKTPAAIQVGAASLALRPGSLLADKLVVRSIHIQSPEVTFETDFKGNNLSRILSNLKSTGGAGEAGGADTSAPPRAGRKLQVDEFIISGAKLNVSVTPMGGQAITVPLPEIRLANLGQGPEGITPDQLAKKVMEAIEAEAIQASSGAIGDLTRNAADLGKELGKGLGKGGETVEKTAKGLGGLFKKK